MKYQYYEWSQIMTGESDGRETWVLEFPILDDLEDACYEAKPVDGWDEQLVATYPPGDCPRRDFPVTDTDWPVYSPRLRELMEKLAPKLIQYLPFRLQDPEGENEIEGYCVAQYLRHVDCLDRERTRVEANSWEPVNPCGDFGVKRPLYLDRNKIGNEKVFRIQGDSCTVVIRQDLKEAIEEAGITGCDFEKLNVVP